MREMTVTSFCTVSPEPGQTSPPGVVHIPSGEAVDQTLARLYSPFKLRRLDAYSRAALLAARLALEAAGEDMGGVGDPTESSRLGIVVCSGLGPIPATNAFMDSYMDFGPSGASPTTFSQTVHNLAASTIAMFMGLVGPALSVSQPSLGLSSALATASTWFDADLADTILFGTVDDHQTFSRHLFPDCVPCSSNSSPVAAFAVLSTLPGLQKPSHGKRDIVFRTQRVTDRSPASAALAQWTFCRSFFQS